MKILGAVIAVISFRWVAKIFKGKDGEFSQVEFGKFVGFWFFLSAASYMIYKEGTREHEWAYYSEWYIAIVFGCLLFVLHMERALDSIERIIDSLIRLRLAGKGAKANAAEEEKPEKSENSG